MNVLTEYRDVVLLCVVVFSLLLFIIILSQRFRLTKLRKRMDAMLGDTGAESLEAAITELQKRSVHLQEKSDQTSQDIQSILEQMKQMKGKMSIIRYNAFNETGSDLSFSVAILDGHGNGMVLTGIHSRHDTQIYAKPVDKGQSSYSLSPEEKEVVTRALQA